jgi:hypothetical protein
VPNDFVEWLPDFALQIVAEMQAHQRSDAKSELHVAGSRGHYGLFRSKNELKGRSTKSVWSRSICFISADTI